MIKMLLKKVTFSQKIIFIKDDIIRIVDREYRRQDRRYTFNKQDLRQRYQDTDAFITKVIIPNIDGSEIITSGDGETCPDLATAISGLYF